MAAGAALQADPVLLAVNQEIVAVKTAERAVNRTKALEPCYVDGVPIPSEGFR